MISLVFPFLLRILQQAFTTEGDISRNLITIHAAFRDYSLGCDPGPEPLLVLALDCSKGFNRMGCRWFEGWRVRQRTQQTYWQLRVSVEGRRPQRHRHARLRREWQESDGVHAANVRVDLW